MRFGLLIYLIFGAFTHTSAQVSDGFDYSASGIHERWQGDIGKFILSNEGKLQLNAPAVSDVAYVSTPSNAIAEGQWESLIEITENPSSSNFSKFYLVSDQPYFTQDLNGYFVKIGGSTDEISLYRQDGNTEVKIIDGADDRVNLKPVVVTIRVTRDMDGNWQLYSKLEGETDFLLEGTTQDLTYNKSMHSGLLCQYTSTRNQAFAFDYVEITGGPQPDLTPPQVVTASILSNQQIGIKFSEYLDPVSASNTSLYQSYHAVSKVQLPSPDSVILTFETIFNNADSIWLDIRNLEDSSGNTINDTTFSFFYFEYVAPNFGDLIFTELFADPTPTVGSLPDEAEAEFIEIFNKSNAPFNLASWKINESMLPEYIIKPNEFVILCRTAYQTVYDDFGSTLTVSNWPTLSNSGGTLTLIAPSNQVIDSVTYHNAQVAGGVSLELINPFSPCWQQASNWKIAEDVTGATPGQGNSVWDETPDSSAPQIIETITYSPDSLIIQFDEPVYATENSMIQLFPTTKIHQWSIDHTEQQMALHLEESLSSEMTYSLNISGFEDCSGNVLEGTSLFYADFTPPEFTGYQWIDTSSITFYWHEKLEKSSITPKDHYLLLPDSVQPYKVDFGNDSSSFTLYFRNALMGSDSLEISFFEIADTTGNKTTPFSLKLFLQNNITSVQAIHAYQIDVLFTTLPDQTSATTSENYLLNQSTFPVAAILDDTNPQLIHLIFTDPIAENKLLELQITHVQGISSQLFQTPVSRFVYDTKPPILDSLMVIDPQHIQLFWNEPVIGNLSDNQFLLNKTPISPDDISNPNIFHFTQSNLLKQESENTLSYFGVSDTIGNKLTEWKKLNFLYDTRPPSVVSAQFLSPSLLKINFSEPLASYAISIDSISLTNDIHPVEIVLVQDSVLVLSFEETIPDEEEIFFAGISDLAGNTDSSGISLTLNNTELRIGSVIPLSDSLIMVNFTQSVEAGWFQQENFTLNYNSSAHQISLPEQNNYSCLLSFDTPLENFNLLEISSSYLQPSAQQVEFLYDEKVASISQLNETSLSIRFSVPIKLPELAASFFTVDDTVTPLLVTQPDPYTFHLWFKETISQLEVHQLHLDYFPDAIFGYIPTSDHHFGKGSIPQKLMLLITEVMPDPTPAQQLPEQEYMELYNASSEILDLTGLQITDGTSTATIFNGLIRPHSYIIICGLAYVSLFEKYGKTIGVSNFPSLNSQTDKLSLINTEGEIIFEVQYSDDWYHDQEKAEGGWSLEMVDTQNPCGESANWSASVSTAGGTPGQQNSIADYNPDQTYPFIAHATAISDTEIEIQFNERIIVERLNPDLFQLDHDLQVTNLREVTPTSLTLVTSHIIPLNKPIQLTYKNLCDCAGNISQGEKLLTIIRPEPVEPGDMIFHEILFNPRAGGVSFIEVRNVSDKYLDLSDLSFAAIKADTIFDLKPVLSRHRLIAPGEILAFTESKVILKGDYPSTQESQVMESSQLPSLYVSGGSIGLLSNTDTIDLLTYREEMHHPMLKEPKGVSLERVMNGQTTESLWRSAASTTGFATPGYANSQTFKIENQHTILTIEPKVFSPQQGNLNYTDITFQSIPNGSIGTIQIFDMKGNIVRTLLNQATLSETGSIPWDGTDDDIRLLPLGHYIVFFQFYNLQGEVFTYRSKVVIGSPF